MKYIDVEIVGEYNLPVHIPDTVEGDGTDNNEGSYIWVENSLLEELRKPFIRVAICEGALETVVYLNTSKIYSVTPIRPWHEVLKTGTNEPK